MARKPNYKFERLQRERAKAAKKAARLEAKKNKAAAKSEDGETPISDETVGATNAGEAVAED